MNNQLPLLPLSGELESRSILKKLARAHSALAELKGVAEIVPNQNIIISTLALQEAKDSSAIENIVTTHDELYKSDVAAKQFTTFAAKEVFNYSTALQEGYLKVKKSGLLTNKHILSIQETIEGNSAGFRKLPGTELKNEQTKEVIYKPPQDGQQVEKLMHNLEQFINNDDINDDDPLTKMAVIHHQFESIHPFYDGNGRTGRIINVLYLVRCNLLDTPVLYLSRYINKNKGEYYRLLQAVRDHQVWEDWILYMLEAVIQTALQTISLIRGIRQLMLEYKHIIRTESPKSYSHELLNNIFYYPYTKIHFIEKGLGISRLTATNRLNELTRIGLMQKVKKGRDVYYINARLFKLLSNANEIIK